MATKKTKIRKIKDLGELNDDRHDRMAVLSTGHNLGIEHLMLDYGGKYSGSPSTLAHRLWNGLVDELDEDDALDYLLEELNGWLNEEDDTLETLNKGRL